MAKDGRRQKPLLAVTHDTPRKGDNVVPSPYSMPLRERNQANGQIGKIGLGHRRDRDGVRKSGAFRFPQAIR